MSAAPVSSPDHERDRHFTANLITSLREDYQLRTDEAERAVSLFLRRKAGWSTPDQAAFEAYRWWVPTVEPSVVLAREAEQRAHATGTTISAGPGRGVTPVADPMSVLDPQTTSETFADFESALSMIRTQGDVDGFTADHLALARQLRELLDQSPVWDTITPDSTIQDGVAVPPLEPALQPETVRPNDDWDDIIALDATFAGRTITILRPPGQIGTFSYVFLADTPGTHYTKQPADTPMLGRIAAGDGEPDPARAAQYDDLGQQVRRHLIGLVDAVAEARELRQEQESRRLHAAQTSLGSVAEAAYQRLRPAHGTSR